MIQPVNGHLIIEPLVHESFITSSKETYDEVGIVLAVAKNLQWVEGGEVTFSPVEVGQKVFFDSWLAAKYPSGDSYFWLVKWEDVRAIENEE